MDRLKFSLGIVITTALWAPALANGPTAEDVQAYSAALASLPGKDDPALHDRAAVIAGARNVVDVATAVAERDYPQLGASVEACRKHLVSNGDGLTYSFEPAFQYECQRIDQQFAPLLELELGRLDAAMRAQGASGAESPRTR